MSINDKDLANAIGLHGLMDKRVDAEVSTGDVAAAITTLVEYAEYFPVHARELAYRYPEVPEFRTINWPSL